MNLVLFDIDGTLTHSDGAGRRTFDKVFSRIFNLKDVSEGMEFAGKTDPMIIRDIFQKHLSRVPTQEEMIRIKRSYITLIEDDVRSIRSYKAVEGVSDLLSALSESRHVLLGLATGNFRETAFLKLESAGLRKFFNFGGFGSDSANRVELVRLSIERGKKLIPHKQKFEKAFVVGDTREDVRAGKEAGAVTIAMLTGGATFEDLRQHAPDHILPGFLPAQSFLSIVNGHEKN